MTFVIRTFIDGRCMWLGDSDGPLFDTSVWVDSRSGAVEYTDRKRADADAAVAFKNCGIPLCTYTAIITTSI